MPCYKPLEAYRATGGSITFKRSESLGQSINLKCGQCIGCRLERSRAWAIRCINESQMYENNCFITLTYDDKNVPSDEGLRKQHFQKFMKRLRSQNQQKIRYYMCGEYGSEFGRPHYHALIFNHDFEDKYKWTTRNSNQTYRSNTLEMTWPLGYSEIGEITLQSAAYVARYVMKKITGKNAENHYEKVNPDTGEVHQIQPEYNNMSLRPGIGKVWFEKYHTDIFPADCITLRGGQKVKVPPYYDKLHEEMYPKRHAAVKNKRIIEALKHLENQTPERLRVREICAKAKLNQKRRELT